MVIHAKCFDANTAWELKATKANLFVGYNRFCLWTLAEMRKRGIPSIVERGSVHSSRRASILSEECDTLGVPAPPTNSQELTDRECDEYELADVIIVPSEFAASSFTARRDLLRKIALLPYGVDTNLFRPLPEPSSEFTVLSVGNLGIEKGTHYLVRALESLGGLRVRLILVGGVDAYLRHILNNTALDVTCLGRCSQAELATVYATASVFCLPSIQDGCALVTLEAMASGLPVITTPNNGASELIDDGVDGFVVPTRSAEALAKRLLALYEDAALGAEIGIRAREKAMQHTWDNYGTRLFSLYRLVAGDQWTGR